MERLFLSVDDIRTILGCSYTKAEEIAHMFIRLGFGVQHGKMLRVRTVAFNAWAGIDRELCFEEVRK